MLEDQDVQQLLRAAVEKSGSQWAFSRETGVARMQVNQILNGSRPVCQSIIESLNLRIAYVSEGKKVCWNIRMYCYCSTQR
jgi:hypothetical protein